MILPASVSRLATHNPLIPLPMMTLLPVSSYALVIIILLLIMVRQITATDAMYLLIDEIEKRVHFIYFLSSESLLSSSLFWNCGTFCLTVVCQFLITYFHLTKLQHFEPNEERSTVDNGFDNGDSFLRQMISQQTRKYYFES